MNWAEILTIAGFVSSIVGGIVLWIERQYIAAKNQVIEAKEAEITLLERQLNSERELNSPRVREHFINTKVFLEEQIGELQKQLGNSRREIELKDVQLEGLSPREDDQAIDTLSREKKELEDTLTALQIKLTEKETISRLTGSLIDNAPSDREDIDLVRAVYSAMQENLERRRELWRAHKFSSQEISEVATNAQKEISRWMTEFQSKPIIAFGCGGMGHEPHAHLQYQLSGTHVSRLHLVVTAIYGRPTLTARIFEGEPEQVRREGFEWVNQQSLY